MLFCIIYTNYDQKWLAKVRKPVIAWDKFRGQASGGGKMVFPEKREGERGVLIFICFETRKLDLMLIMNSGNCW